ncbi:antifreeze protein [Phyllobacterium leguminum]|uniref:Antifreeze protein n=1 Tax=Phyllobacterium leguminum TaxID=314237 RepID=A0A318SX43_9HYPH|nr:antifreeze protein [Phyllobacterium leguminum]PYE86551.1 hypothetical protein C7477_12342 [Phyllobacterium leguminum]
MSRISLKSLAVTAGLGLAVAFSAGAAANAAPAVPAAPAVATSGAKFIQVDHRWGHHGYRPARACSADHAALKAERMGFRRVSVNVRRDTIRVSGWRKGFRSSVLFARAPGCPVIR